MDTSMKDEDFARTMCWYYFRLFMGREANLAERGAIEDSLPYPHTAEQLQVAICDYTAAYQNMIS